MYNKAFEYTYVCGKLDNSRHSYNPSQNMLAVVDKISKINTTPSSPPVSMFKNVSVSVLNTDTGGEGECIID